MTTCLRCGDSVVHSNPDRFRLRATDMCESSASWYKGRLCAACWTDLVRFMREDPCQRRWATA